MTGGALSRLSDNSAENDPFTPGEHRWEGFFLDPREFVVDDGDEGAKKYDLTLLMVRVSPNRRDFTAYGTDEVGDFQFKRGKISGHQVTFTKSYVSHEINYAGTCDGVRVTGTWWFYHPQDGGTFEMWPAHD